MQSLSMRSLLLAAGAMMLVSAAQAQMTDAQKAAAERKAAAAGKAAAPAAAAKPADNLSAKAVKPTSQKLTPAAQSVPYKDEAGCHSKASDA